MIDTIKRSNFLLLCMSIMINLKSKTIAQQDASVLLKQGTVVGLKVFPETSRTPIFTYLGIPYAKPPVGNLRFAPPEEHNGWNQTLYARNYQAICPQIENNIYEEATNGYPYQSRISEDCLYLNIWTPEISLRYGNTPVLCIISGEEMAFDWTRNRLNGLDLASEGIIVITIQSRTNVFGWLTLETAEAPGNLGLLDQHLAFKWIRENIYKFGGNPAEITLMGHGTTGSPSAMIHLVATKSKLFFKNMIFISGTIYSSYSFQGNHNRVSPSLAIIKNLACDSTNSRISLECLRSKSISDLLKAFENIYKDGNYTTILGPQIDKYLEDSKRYIPEDPRILISQKKFPDIPIMIGLCNNEGAFMRAQWLDHARTSSAILKKYILTTTIPNVLDHYGFFSASANEHIKETINWRFFDQIPMKPANLLSSLQRLISETKYEAPFFETIEIFSRDFVLENNVLISTINTSALVDRADLVLEIEDISSNDNVMEHRIESDTPSLPTKFTSLFVYSFQQPNSMDLRGNINYFGGASHSTELLFLMGPSLFQQISRRKLSQSEEKLCKKMRQQFSEFIKTGNPTPGRLFDAWVPYTKKQKYIQIYATMPALQSVSDENSLPDSILEKNKVQIENLLSADADQAILPNEVDIISPYQVQRRNNGNNRMQDERTSKSYMPDLKNSDYYIVLHKIYTFWYELLPKMYKKQILFEMKNKRFDMNHDEELASDREIIYAEQESSLKFKHAFFSMLVLVCLLLALLGLCVYLFKKQNKHFDTSYL